MRRVWRGKRLLIPIIGEDEKRIEKELHADIRSLRDEMPSLASAVKKNAAGDKAGRR